MSQDNLRQMGHLRPGTDDAPTHHVGNNLGCPRLSWDRWDISDLGLMMVSYTMSGTTLDVQVVLDCTKDNSRCPRCPELSLGLLWHMMAIPDNPR